MAIVPPTRRTEAEARLVAALSNLKRAGEEVQFDTHAGFVLSASMLLTMIHLAGDVTPRDSEDIVTSTLLAMFRADERTIEQFEDRIRKLQSDRLKVPKRTFHLLASVRAKNVLHPTKGTIVAAKVGAVNVRLVRDFPKKAKVGAFRVNGDEINLRGSTPYIPLWATVKARSELEAADRATAAIKAVLGCINLALNHKIERHHSGRRLPRNTVRLVGEQIVYRSDWSRYDDFFFYEEESDHPERWPVDLERDLERNWKPLERMLARLSDPIFGSLLLEAMQDYHEALSHVDAAFVHARLWGLLERLTNSQADESRATIRRAAFLSTATEVRRQRLKHAADARHAFIHRRVRAPFIDHLAEDLRHWAEEMLIYIFFVRRKFRDLDFFFSLLAAPQTAKEIERAASVLKVAKELVR